MQFGRHESAQERVEGMRVNASLVLALALMMTGCAFSPKKLSAVKKGPFMITHYARPESPSVSLSNPITVKPAWRSARSVCAYDLSPDLQM